MESAADILLTRRVLLAAAAASAAELALSACGPDKEILEPPLEPHVTMETKEVLGQTDLLQAGPWQYMDGVKVTPNGLVLSPTDRAIINKRENRVEANPPINLFGPRLQVEGDFAVSSRMSGKGTVTMQLYGQAPVRFDDFRFERSRLECQTFGNTLRVRIWDGTDQEPSMQTFPFSGSTDDRRLEVRREANNLVFVVNGQQVGSAPKGAIFASGEVWFGCHTERSPATVSELTARQISGHKVSIVDTSSLRVTQPTPGGLQSLVRKPNFRIGAAAALGPMVSDTQYAQLLLGGEFGTLTPENALKPQDVQPAEGVFCFGEADALVALAERHGIQIHGHTLVYQSATPDWMNKLPYATEADKQRVRQVLEQHVTAVVSHFKGRITSWDVVNEPIDGFNNEAHLQENIWYKALGEEYIEIALRAAHAADPNTKLYINDFGLETNPQGRGQEMLKLAKRLKARGVPLDGIGIEGHVYELPRDTIKPAVLRQLLNDFGGLELQTRISELDVTKEKGSDAQTAQYADVLRVCVEAPNCVGFGIWGATDKYGSTGGTDGKRLYTGNALPFTASYQAKPAHKAMAGVLTAQK